LAGVESAKKGVFDDATESAMKRFQKFHNLPVTGKLDKETLAEMDKPRCGFPDVGEFTNTGRRWPGNRLTYAFQEFTPDLPANDVILAIEQAFALWSAETSLCFHRVAITSNPDIIIRFVSGNHGDGDQNAFDGPGDPVEF
jgi:hypothetical protein